ncbi:glycosyltransferase family 4 protein [Solwaraspora sp. WMMD406]|uniref:glycosyltransferase family 4 protein n=1 Tax=Solwaraspora sp. WMMD406 TaxID=3016095 RepID=UPI00241808DD|nr:glycosyltransferase family 4 protein [Solwaraspora sp. WMMD406]MDG4766888.1 glycosyltransferase family 4 protein [Solwaraspora sp. WMMD406]
MVCVVLPGDVDDPTAPSGGNVYDRQLCHELRAAGWPVREIVLPGGWPRPGPADRQALAAALADLPDATVVLLDGLVACGVPEVVTPHAGRLRLGILVHLPLADETGLTPAVAAARDAAERATLRAADAVIATSGWTARRLVEHHGLDERRTLVARPGVAPAPLAAGTADGGRLLCVAAVTPRKAHDVLVEALATVADLAWECVCVGALDRSGGQVARVRSLLTDHRLHGRVRLVGPRGGAELARSYADADLLILPSHAETYGMVITEALAHGLPVLATEVGGVPEALGRAADGTRPGILVPPGDPPALGAALRGWLTDTGQRTRLRSAAVDRRAGLSGWASTAGRIAEVLARLR